MELSSHSLAFSKSNRNTPLSALSLSQPTCCRLSVCVTDTILGALCETMPWFPQKPLRENERTVIKGNIAAYLHQIWEWTLNGQPRVVGLILKMAHFRNLLWTMAQFLFFFFMKPWTLYVLVIDTVFQEIVRHLWSRLGKSRSSLHRHHNLKPPIEGHETPAFKGRKQSVNVG